MIFWKRAIQRKIPEIAFVKSSFLDRDLFVLNFEKA